LITCIRCGQQNPDGSKYCQSCKAALPKISESVSAAAPERINVHYNQLKEVGDKILSGAITDEEFAGTIDRIYEVIQARLNDLENLQIAPEVIPKVEEELQLGLAGIQYFLQGIEEMKLFLQDRNQEHITLGMESVFQGNENLNNALEMARDNIRKLKDMGIESEIDTRDIPG